MRTAACQGTRRICEGIAASRPFFVGANGFTLTELVVVISIVAILSVYAAARFTGTEFDARAATDRLFAQISYARKAAIAGHRPVCVHLSANQSVLFYGSVSPDACGGTVNVPSPAGPTPFTVGSGGTVFGPVGVYRFDALGRYLNPDGSNAAASLTIQVNGANAFFVERETGYVHP